MKMQFSNEDIIEILSNHIRGLGFEAGKASMSYKDEKEYEHFGDPTRQDRREVSVRKFTGVEIEAKLICL